MKLGSRPLGSQPSVQPYIKLASVCNRNYYVNDKVFDGWDIYIYMSCHVVGGLKIALDRSTSSRARIVE